MTVSSSFLSPLRFFSRPSLENAQDLVSLPSNSGEVARPSANQLYIRGSQFSPDLQGKKQVDAAKSRTAGILRIIANFNSEPLLPGNGFILFNRTRMLRAWLPIAAHEALDILTTLKPVRVDLARVRPAAYDKSRRQVQIIPISDFSYQIESEAALATWWQTVGHNFCDGLF